MEIREYKNSIRVFISYAYHDKKLGEIIKQGLENLGFICFLAHKDIPSGKWREIIDRNLLEFDVFLPLLTENARKSVWVHQESGIAHFRKKSNNNLSIIPLKIEYNPEGCLSEYQAHKLEFNLMGGLRFGNKEILNLAKKFVEETHSVSKCKLPALSQLIYKTGDQVELIMDFVEWTGLTLDDTRYILRCLRKGKTISPPINAYEKVIHICSGFKTDLFRDSAAKSNLLWLDRSIRKYKDAEQKKSIAQQEALLRSSKAINNSPIHSTSVQKEANSSKTS